ncbi:hypothetical protein BDN70DRAFT_890887 [Pholiota conissans]|uniref:Period circadian protein n=1 Tax=Pholiota conissans TaxID=109636 RepID=A0A9P5ZBW8_9AGAR|nr:hypothetical protein BDN70DRAFT_890887 [Pholiota conissans]
MHSLRIFYLAALLVSSTRASFVDLVGRQLPTGSSSDTTDANTVLEQLSSSNDHSRAVPAANQTQVANDLAEIISGFNQACGPLGIPTLTVADGTPTNTAIGADPSGTDDGNTFSTPAAGGGGSSAVFGSPTGSFNTGIGSGPSITVTGGGGSAQTGLGGLGGGSSSNGNIGGSSSNTGSSSSSSTSSGQSPQGNGQKGNGAEKTSLSILVLGLAGIMNIMFL